MSGLPSNPYSRNIQLIDNYDDNPPIITPSVTYSNFQNRAANLYHTGINRFNRFINDNTASSISQHDQREDSGGFSNFGRNLAWIILFIAIAYLIMAFIITILVSTFSFNDDIDIKSKKTKPADSKSSGPTSKFTKVYFKDILGVDEAKKELEEVVKFIREPEKYRQIGARIPKGVLLIGPPGTGKTMLARAVATEAGIQFIFTSGSEFVEIYVGQGARRIRNLFEHARSIAPCIIFIDELDAVGARRISGSGNPGNREHDQTLNQLLVELDGFSTSSGITVIAATNRLDYLDSALLRPGRFDRLVHVPLPDKNGREAILNMYLSRVVCDKDVSASDMASLTFGFSGAELENLVNEAALCAVRNGRTKVTKEDMFEARDKVMMGPARPGLQFGEERRVTAYHEAGHAVVALILYPSADPIHKATIISRGNALGFVEQMPPGDRYGYHRHQMLARLAVCMGGRVAEELVFGYSHVSSGASSDIKAATDLAYRMVTEWGMTEELGPVSYKNYMSSHILSPETTAKVEYLVKKLVKEGHRKAESILRRNRDKLEKVAEALLERETLSGEEIKEICSHQSGRDSRAPPVRAIGPDSIRVTESEVR